MDGEGDAVASWCGDIPDTFLVFWIPVGVVWAVEGATWTRGCPATTCRDIQQSEGKKESVSNCSNQVCRINICPLNIHFNMGMGKHRKHTTTRWLYVHSSAHVSGIFLRPLRLLPLLCLCCILVTHQILKFEENYRKGCTAILVTRMTRTGAPGCVKFSHFIWSSPTI